MKPPGRNAAEDLQQDVERRRIRMRTGGNVVTGHNNLRIARATPGHKAFAVLDWLDSVNWLEHPTGSRDLAKAARDQCQRFLRIKPTGDQQNGVVGLIIIAVESLQSIDRNVLNITADANRVPGVVVPIVG